MSMSRFIERASVIFRGARKALPALVLLAAGSSALAQTYPTRPVKIIVPFAAGGPADNYARFIAQRLQESLGQSFVVDNKPGAGSVIGTDVAAKAPPDGYTLLLMSNAHTVNETLIPNKPFALMRDFVAVAPINYSDLVLVANPGVPDKTLKDLIKRAKAQPGKINYASSGPGTPYHMAGRAVQEHGRRVPRAHSLPGQLRRAHRRDRRAGGTDVRRRDHHGRAGARRQGPGAGHDRPGAIDACCPTFPRSAKPACPATRPRSGSA